ncbi:MAG: hypothetical protein Q8P41_07920 [Pseudomonadota bacterium]|nr:hypothetical protein [Pseudomonadota bacterium]
MSFWRSLIRWTVVVGTLVGCDGPAEEGKDTAASEDDTGGGGTGTLWRPAGEGTAYFADGAEDNSLFHLELSRCNEPREGEAYYGWVSKGGEEPIAVGEITVAGEEVYFEYDIGVNAIIQGFDTFEAWATDNGGTARDGEQLWVGEVDPVVYGTIQTLLIASPDTPDGQGSLRSVETAVQDIRVRGQEAVDAPFDLESFQDDAEAIANALEGTSEDLNDDGTVSVIEGQLGVLNDAGYIGLILLDLDAASAQVDPGNPIKDYVNYAYDCTQAIESHARAAAIDADVTTICLAESSCESRMADVLVELEYALTGEDINEDGVLDELTEGTIECAISYVSQLAQMTVATP